MKKKGPKKFFNNRRYRVKKIRNRTNSREISKNSRKKGTINGK